MELGDTELMGDTREKRMEVKTSSQWSEKVKRKEELGGDIRLKKELSFFCVCFFPVTEA